MQNKSKQTATIPVRASIDWVNTKEDDNVRASASLTIGGAYTVHGIKVINGAKGVFVAMPSYKSGDNYKDIFHAVTAEARQQLNDAVMNAYEQKMGKGLTEETSMKMNMR